MQLTNVTSILGYFIKRVCVCGNWEQSLLLFMQ